ncbi:MAG: endonuclease [Amaricoccus sp.]
MAERSTTSNEMFWAFLWWLAALVAAILVFAVLSSIVKDDPAAGIVFGGVTFVLVGLLLVYLGPGPKPSDAVATDHWHAPEPAHPAPEPAARVAAPLAAPVHVPPAADPHAPTPAPGPDAPISERVRDAARAAGEAARAALGEAASAAAPVRPAALAAPAEGAADDLKTIKGVGPKLEELLHSLGIFHFGQVAGWGPAEVAWMDSNLEGFQGRVTRDDWVGQAKLLASGGETDFSRRVDRGEVY